MEISIKCTFYFLSLRDSRRPLSEIALAGPLFLFQS